MMDPIVNAPIDFELRPEELVRLAVRRGMQKLRLDYLAAKNADDRHKAIEAIQLRFLE